jgi:GNAT superfamily N-acetyltransferase
MDVLALTGRELGPVLPALAELRIRVFRDWPYLYDGTLEYEASYLRKFSAAKDAVIVVAREGERIVGASTASPLLGHADEFAKPFAEQGYDLDKVFYFGESVLLPEYRGRGLGRAFFDVRESHARRSGPFEIAAFCAVVREASDPRAPAGYHPLDAFWNKRGYFKQEALTTTFPWKELGQDEEVLHPMQYWIKRL